MIKQFFGKEFWSGIALVAVFFVTAFLGYFFGYPSFFLIVVFFATLSLTMAQIEFGIVIAFLELFCNPHGQLLSSTLLGFPFSLRMAIFCAVMIGWGIQLFQKRVSVSILDERLRIFVVLFSAIFLGFIVGVMKNPLGAVFSDGNAYFYLLYVFPILSIRWTTQKQKTLLQILTSGVISNVIVTFVSLYIFSHFGESVLRTSYGFLRDLRIAEVTNLGDGFYRVFQQTHFFVIVLLLLVFAIVLQKQKFGKGEFIYSSVGLSIVLLSLSRSFWVGSFVAITALVCVMMYRVRPTIQRFGYLGVLVIITGVVGAIFVLCVTLFPFPQMNLSGADLADILSKRATETSDVAVSSRWALLKPMGDTIKDHPIEGSGFGSSVTFISDDPRVREINETGEWTTSSMEWGWLEIWMKMGILAPIGFLLILFSLWKRFLFSSDTPRNWLHVGLSSALLFLAMTHFFSPYLNHPIGLGFILFCLPFLPEKIKQDALVKAPDLIEIQKSKVIAVASTQD